MRGSVDGLATPHPLGRYLPSVYQEHELSMRYTAAFDDVLAPIQLTLDCLDSYFDPGVAPEDVLQWLGGWVGLVLDPDWPIERRRSLVSGIVDLYAARGTAWGLVRLVELFTGAATEIIEGGAVSFSLIPDAAIPGTDADAFIVRVRAPRESVDAARLEVLVHASRPAHLSAVIEFVSVEFVPAMRDQLASDGDVRRT